VNACGYLNTLQGTFASRQNRL